MSRMRDYIQVLFMIRFRLAELIAEKSFRERRAISMSEVALGSGVHRATLSKMANQPGTNASTDVVDKLCRYFGCQPGDLLTYVEDVKPVDPG
ncbi:helix-turn-helix domain-containing protein [Cognatilysobacter segetis]|uniref:helix-turn-helix domain-containing protein n=1 Tax=Cognatilysobacter segetis TaxID=2492394 RepID=UPI00192E64DE|nr:helix-turn-helix transcriptional regulator [Lysobacter segetis]